MVLDLDGDAQLTVSVFNDMKIPCEKLSCHMCAVNPEFAHTWSVCVSCWCLFCKQKQNRDFADFFGSRESNRFKGMTPSRNKHQNNNNNSNFNRNNILEYTHFVPRRYHKS